MQETEAIDQGKRAGEACELLTRAISALEVAGLTTAAAMTASALDEAASQMRSITAARSTQIGNASVRIASSMSDSIAL